MMSPLKKIFENNDIKIHNLIKIDCGRAEFEILYNYLKGIFGRIERKFKYLSKVYN
jgi:hypothetical protein